jgi:hypothetical protein
MVVRVGQGSVVGVIQPNDDHMPCSAIFVSVVSSYQYDDREA